MTLSTQRKVFVEEYLSCWNATEAARKAEYKHPNKMGPRLIKDPEIQTEIQSRLSEKVMSANEVLIRLSEIGRYDASKYFCIKKKTEIAKTIAGDIPIEIEVPSIDIDQVIADGFGAMIKSVKRTKYGDVVVFHDQEKIWELLGKHHGLFVERTENKSDVNVTLNIEGLDRLLDKVYGSKGNTE